MGITKNQLKSIVKECLIEIFAEGLGPAVKENITEAALKKSNLKQVIHASSILQQNASKTRLAQNQHDAIKEAIKVESGGNSVMAEILADTAANTLPTMLEGDRTKNTLLPHTGTAERVVAAATPDQLFGSEATSKWAALAFMDASKK